MWWLAALVALLVLVGVAAVAVERRRGSVGGDAREDRFIDPGKNRPKRLSEKLGEHGPSNG